MAEIFVIVIFFILVAIAAVVLFAVARGLRHRKLNPDKPDIEPARAGEPSEADEERRPEHLPVANEQQVDHGGDDAFASGAAGSPHRAGSAAGRSRHAGVEEPSRAPAHR